jgi:hypothetical protein
VAAISEEDLAAVNERGEPLGQQKVDQPASADGCASEDAEEAVLNAGPGLNRKRPWTVRQVMETRVGGSGMYRSFLAIPYKERKKPVSSYRDL